MFGSFLNLAIAWVVLTIAFLAAAAIVPGVEIKDAKSGFWVAAVFAVVNVLLNKLLAFLFGVVTLGIACLLPGLVRFLVTVVVILLTSGTRRNRGGRRRHWNVLRKGPFRARSGCRAGR